MYSMVNITVSTQQTISVVDLLITNSTNKLSRMWFPIISLVVAVAVCRNFNIQKSWSEKKSDW